MVKKHDSLVKPGDIIALCGGNYNTLLLVDKPSNITRMGMIDERYVIESIDVNTTRIGMVIHVCKSERYRQSLETTSVGFIRQAEYLVVDEDQRRS